MDGYPINFIRQDLRKGKADIIAIQAYIAEQVIGSQDGKPVLTPGATSSEAGSLSTFLNFLGDNSVATDPSKVEKQLMTSPKILQSDEKVEQAYKLGKDLCLFTTKRILLIDFKGLSGSKVEYKSFPLRYCQAFKILTAGGFLSDPEAKIYFEDETELSQDLSKSSSDIWAVHKILANKILL